MPKSPVLLTLIVAALPVAAAPSTDSEEAAYRKVIQERADRIVERVDVADDDQRARVSGLIAEQYRKLRDEHDALDQRLDYAGEAETALRDASHRRVVELHRRFLARLRAELTPEQVEQVKDGMTYGVAPITYAAYQRLLPDLTKDQKRFILANLIEAREHAMDGGSSDEKHACFGKYKGRINNYLSAEGYDLKQAERDLAEREER